MDLSLCVSSEERSMRATGEAAAIDRLEYKENEKMLDKESGKERQKRWLSLSLYLSYKRYIVDTKIVFLQKNYYSLLFTGPDIAPTFLFNLMTCLYIYNVPSYINSFYFWINRL